MMRSLFSGVSGLRNHQVRMDVIGNNIANVNTVGFKSSRVNFEEIFSQTLRGASTPRTDIGGTNPQQVGLGMTIASVDTMFSQGNLQTTGKNTDLAIQGNGFFLLDNGGAQVYTRAGMFDVDADGNLVNPDGLRLMGWQADAQSGNIDTTKAVETLSIPIGQSKLAQATSRITYTSNLAADAPNGTRVTTSVKVFDSLGTSHDVRVDFVKQANNTWSWEAVGYGSTATAPPTGVTGPALAGAGLPTGTYRVNIDAYNKVATLTDSTGTVVGTASNLVAGATNTFSDASGNPVYQLNFPTPLVTGTRDVTVAAGPTTAFTGSDPSTGALTGVTVPQGSTLPTGNYQVVVDTSSGTSATLRDAQGNVLGSIPNVSPGAANTFRDSAGRDLLTVTFPATPGSGTAAVSVANVLNSGTISFDAQGMPVGGTTDNLAFTPLDGANPLSITMDFTGVTQMAAPNSSIAATGRDGYAMGALNTFTIDSSGVITGSFSNGLTQKLGQIALANFSNIGGLMKTGNNNYMETNNSGLPQVGAANSGGRGSIAPANLEQSNVDLSQEFANMIITERGFQANSRVITTSDEMLQELVNLKR